MSKEIEEKINQIEAMANLTGGVISGTNLQPDKNVALELGLGIRDLFFDSEQELSSEDAVIIMDSLVKIGRSNNLEDADYIPEDLRMFFVSAIDPRGNIENPKETENVFGGLDFKIPGLGE